jgi:hypothetical protein
MPSPIHIFAVEDDPIHQENLRITLDELGYSLLGLEDRAEGILSKIQRVQPDVLLLDIQLAGAQDGIQLVLYELELYLIGAHYSCVSMLLKRVKLLNLLEAQSGRVRFYELRVLIKTFPLVVFGVDLNMQILVCKVFSNHKALVKNV